VQGMIMRGTGSAHMFHSPLSLISCVKMFNWLVNMFDKILHTVAQKTLVKVQIPGQILDP
jgi:hypothetical protein